MDELESSDERYNRLVEENLKRIRSEDAAERLFAKRELAKIAKNETGNDFGKQIVFDLVCLLKFAPEKRENGCEEIIWALGTIGSEDAVDILEWAANDRLADIRLEAIKALGKIGGEKAKRALSEKWNNHLKDGGEDPKIIGELRKALEGMGVIARKSSGNELMNHRESFERKRRHRKRTFSIVLKKIVNFINPLGT